MKRANRLTFMSFLVGVLFLLTACGSVTRTDVTEYIEVDFWGYDTNGYGEMYVDWHQLGTDVYGAPINSNGSIDTEDEDIEEEVDALFRTLSLDLSPSDELSNGDTVTASVDFNEEEVLHLNPGEVDVTVEGLEELAQLTTEEVERHLVVDFHGADSRGTARIENTFDNEFADINFEIENDGNLSNGDQATLLVNNDLENTLESYGYRLEDDFNPIFEVTGLVELVEDPNEIENIEDITRMISEEVNRKYKVEWYTTADTYDITFEGYYYKQFATEDSSSNYEVSSDASTLFGVYDVMGYDSNGDVVEDEIALIGFNNISADENGHVNVTEMERYFQIYDDTYSVDTVKSIAEGNGYEPVKIDAPEASDAESDSSEEDGEESEDEEESSEDNDEDSDEE